MKQKFVIAVILLIVCVAGFLGYGFYLNYRSNSIIVKQMENRKIQISAAKVAVRDIHPTYHLDNITFTANNTFDVVAKVDGTIEELFVKKNSAVRAGDEIARLSNDDIPLQRAQANSALAKAQAVLKQAENSYSRYKKLWKMDATSLEKLDEAEANYRASLAAVEEAEAQLQQCSNRENNLIVRAPADGRTTIIYRNKGSYGISGTAICLISNFDQMWFALDLDDRIIQRIIAHNNFNNFEMKFSGKRLEKIYDTEYAAGNKGDNQVFPVYVTGIYPDLSKPADRRRVVWHVDNRSWMLEPRSYQDVTLYSPLTFRALAVPVTAMINGEMGQVFVVEKGMLVCRSVITGIRDDNNVEILGGLADDELVVTSGTANLEAGMMVDVLMEGK